MAEYNSILDIIEDKDAMNVLAVLGDVSEKDFDRVLDQAIKETQEADNG